AGGRHEDDELVAAIAEAQIVGTAQFLQALGCARQQLAADKVAVHIVDELEAIEVKEGEAQWVALLEAAVEFAGEHVVKVTDVEEAGGVVRDGELLDAAYVVSILDGDGGVVGEGVEEGDGVVVELPCVGIKNLDDAVSAFATA